MTENTSEGVRRPRTKRPDRKVEVEVEVVEAKPDTEVEVVEAKPDTEVEVKLDTEVEVKLDTEVEVKLDTEVVGTQEVVGDSEKLKSVDNTVKKQKFILTLLKEHPDMSLNAVMEAVRAEFGTRIAFNKAKEAKVAFEMNLPIEARDRRRDRTGNRLSINRHESMSVVVAVAADDKLTSHYLCSGDEEALQQVMKLVSDGIEIDNIQIFQRCHFTAHIKL